MSSPTPPAFVHDLGVLLGFSIAAGAWLFGSSVALVVVVMTVQLIAGVDVDPENPIASFDAGSFALITVVGNGGMALLAVGVAAFWGAPTAPSLQQRLRHNLAFAAPPRIWWPIAVLSALTVGFLPGWIALRLTELVPQLQGGTIDQLSAMIHADAPLSPGVIALMLTLAVGAPVFEEVLFRGLLWRMLDQLGGPVAALVLTTAAFLLIHASFVQIVALVPTALLFAALRYGSGSLWPPMIAHFLNNSLATYSMRATSATDADFALPLWAALLGAGWSFGLVGLGFALAPPARSRG